MTFRPVWKDIATAVEPALQRAKLLFLGDESGSGAVLLSALQARWDVRRALSAGEAGAAVGHEAPTAIIIDFADTTVDSRAVLGELRRRPSWSQTPVIAALGPGAAPDPIRDPELGVRAYLPRPLDATVIRTTIDAQLQLVEAGRRMTVLSEAAAQRASSDRMELERANWALRAYIRSSQALTRLRGLNDVSEQVCEAIVQSGAYVLAFVGLAGPPPEEALNVVAYAGEAKGYLDGLRLSGRADDLYGQGPTGLALRTGQPSFSRDTQTDSAFTPWKDRARKQGIRSSVTVPFMRDNQVAGVLVVYSRLPNAFGMDELAVFQRLADELSLAMVISEDRDRMALAVEEYRTLFRTAHAGLIIADWDAGILDVNPAFTQMTGYSLADVQGRDEVDFLSPENRARAEAAIPGLMTGESFEAEFELEGKDGRRLTVETTTTLHAGGRTLTIMRDVTARKRAEADRRAALEIRQEADARYRRLFEHARDGILISDRDTRIQDMNPSLCRKLGVERSMLIGRRFADIMPGLDWATVGPALAALTPETRFSTEARMTRSDGTVLPIEFSTTAMPDGSLLTIGRDITRRLADEAARQKAEDMLRQTQAALTRVARVSALGEMAATIAHEISQPLAAVSTNSQAATRWLDRDPPNLGEARSALDRIQRDSHRAAEVIRRVRGFTARGEIEAAPFDLNAAVREVIALTSAEQRAARIEVATDLNSTAPLARGDRIQVQQVLVNLTLNAIEALKGSEDGGRRLTISTHLEASSELRVRVEDNGPGLAALGETDIFAPYFTTRPDGTGLGLALSKSIIEAHGGRIWAENLPTGGAAFSFTLERVTGSECAPIRGAFAAKTQRDHTKV